MGISTFGSFTQARLGIYASQAGMSVTGNNISNINTEGYTRQKLHQTSFYAGGADRYYSTYDIRVGNGVLAKGVSQMRDPYLDIRYRSEMASVGAMDSKLAGLEQIQAVLDEVGDGEDGFGILSDNFSDLLSKLHQLSDQTGLAEYDIQVRTSAETLAKQFNSYASQLEEIYENGLSSYEDDIIAVNNILDGIRSLNVNIRKAELHSDNALELRDERNMLIDQLSSYVKINVNYDMEEISGGVKVERLTITLGDANPQDPANPLDPEHDTDCTTLIDGIYGRNFEITDKSTLSMSLSALADEKGRVKSTVKKVTGPDYVTFDTPQTGSSTTDANGVTTITVYEKVGTIYAPNPDYDKNDPDSEKYMKEGGGTTNEKAEAIKSYAYNQSTYTQTPFNKVDLLDNDLYGSLQSQREFLTETGEFASEETLAMDPNAGSKRGVVFYQNALDLLANHFAKTFNEANQDFLRNGKGNYINGKGEEILFNNEPISAANGLTQAQKEKIIQDQKDFVNLDPANNTSADYIIMGEDANTGNLVPVGVDDRAFLHDYLNRDDVDGQPKGEVLFSNRGDGDATDDPPITAANISISKSWAGGPQIVNSFVAYPTADGLKVASTDSSNINHMIIKMTEKMNYNPQQTINQAASNSMFNGDFNEMWTNMGTLLGNDVHSTSTILDTYYAASVEIDTNRSSVSSVDLNDEAMNMMQYSQSYNAACRLMTTLDSMLDKLINGTGTLT